MSNAAVALRSPVAKAAPGNEGYMGDLVAWRFARGIHPFAAPRAKVREIFAEAGFPKCLDDRLEDPASALAEATRTASVGRGGFIAQEFEKKDGDTPYAIGVYYRTGNGEKGDDMVCCARVRITRSAGVDLAVALDPDGGVPTWADAKKASHCKVIAAQIAKDANQLMTHTLANELSAAIVAAGNECFWAPFRKAGGVYWTHAGYAPRLRALLDALEKLGGFWATLQPLFGDADGRTLRNINAAATDAIEAELDDLVAELKKAQANGMKEKSLEARRARCQELVIRADLYRGVLETSHAAIVQRVDAIHRDFGKLLAVADAADAFDTSYLG